MKNKKDMQRIYFFELMKMQIIKHNKRYFTGNALLRSVSGELKTGIVFAKLIEGIVPSATDLPTFESPIHKTHIDKK